MAIALLSIFLLHCPQGTVVLVDCGHPLDDTLNIQTTLDNVAEGGWIVFPDTTGINDKCLIKEAIRIEKPVHILGAIQGQTEIKRDDIYPLSGSHTGGAIFHVKSSHVSIFGLALIGAEYGNVQRRNTHGIWVQPDDPNLRIENFTAQNLESSLVRGRGISLERVDDFVIKGNKIENVGYSGIMLSGVNRGWVDDNEVRSVNDPAACSESCPLSCLAADVDCDLCVTMPTPPKQCQYINSYPIVVTGCSDAVLCSGEIRISGNRVYENERWVGIMNHGGQRILIIDNLVEDTNFLYAQNPACMSYPPRAINVQPGSFIPA